MRRRSLAMALASAALALGACGGDDYGGGSEVIVSAASSLEPAFTAYAEQAGFDARQSFAGSDQIAAQIRAGARPDLYAAANAVLPQELFEQGLVERPVPFASNRLVIAVPAGAARVRAIGDLTEPGTRLAIGAEGVPIGDYTREVVSRLDRPEADAILKNVRSEEPEVAGIVGKLSQRAVDAGFVYVTDVAAAGGELDAIELPARLQPRVSYAAAVVSDAEHPAAAQGFIDGLLAPDGVAALRESGFGPPPGSR